MTKTEVHELNAEQAKLAELERVIEDIGLACKRINEETLTHFKLPADKADFKMVIRRLDAFDAELTELRAAVRLERAAALREAAKHYIIGWGIDNVTCVCGLILGTRSTLVSEAWQQHILALIPTADQSALDALIEKRVAEARLDAMTWCTGAMSLNGRDNAVIQKAIEQEKRKLANPSSSNELER